MVNFRHDFLHSCYFSIGNLDHVACSVIASLHRRLSSFFELRGDRKTRDQQTLVRDLEGGRHSQPLCVHVFSSSDVRNVRVIVGDFLGRERLCPGHPDCWRHLVLESWGWSFCLDLCHERLVTEQRDLGRQSVVAGEKAESQTL